MLKYLTIEGAQIMAPKNMFIEYLAMKCNGMA